MKLQKPVKWIESRRENFLCTIHGRGHVDFYEIAAKTDGTILGIKIKIIQDLGAYFTVLTPAIPTLSVLMMPGLYRTPTSPPISSARSPTALPPTRIAARAGRKPRTASSAWSTCSRPSSRWIPPRSA